MLSLTLTLILTLTGKGTAFSRAEKEPPKSTRLQPLRDTAPNDRPQRHPPAEIRDRRGSLKLR